jgi:arylsulfatase A-like enzyme
MGRFDSVQFPLPHDFYDNYEGRKAASQQEMTVANHLIMGYDLKMFPTEEAENRDGNIHRMNASQRAKFDAYYKPILADFEKRNLSGKELAEWKYQRYMRDYLATATSLDRNIGRTLDYLDQHQLTQNTIVIYISDQGFFLGEHGWFDKRWMYEESFRTPMLMRYPQEVKPGTVNNGFVMNLDIAPTLLQAAGIKVPSDMQGESFLPLVNGKKAKGRKAMYYHYYENGEHAVSPHFGIRTSRYKLIRYYKRVDGWELFDLKKDPDEMNNLYGKKGYDKVTSKLKKQLDALISKYDDTDALQVLQGKSDSTKKAF